MQVGLAKADCAGGEEAADHRGVARRDIVPQHARAGCRRNAGDVDHVLRGEGDAKEWRRHRSVHEVSVAPIGAPPCILLGRGDEGPAERVELCDPRDEHIDQLADAERPPPQPGGELRGRPEGDVRHRHRVVSSGGTAAAGGTSAQIHAPQPVQLLQQLLQARDHTMARVDEPRNVGVRPAQSGHFVTNREQRPFVQCPHRSIILPMVPQLTMYTDIGGAAMVRWSVYCHAG